MTAAQPSPQLPLLPDREDWQAELRQAYADLRMSRRVSFDDAMARAPIATCIRNIAHARRKKGTRR